MYTWTTYLKAIKLCICLLLVSMLVLVHYTLRYNTTIFYEAIQDDSYNEILQWRPQRVLTSSKQQEIQSDVLDSRPPSVLDSRPPSVLDSRPPSVLKSLSTTSTLSDMKSLSTTSTLSDSKTTTIIRRHKPLPHININNVLEANNDTVFLPQYTNSDIHTDSTNTLLEHKHSNHLQTDEVLSPRRAEGGYVVVLKVYEQQTMASGNLLQLQCWSSILNMSLVTPFMKLSNIETPLDVNKQKSYLSLWDTFSKTHWHTHTEAHGYLPLVEWADWIKNGPHKMIIVQFKYPLLSRVKEKEKRYGITFPHPHSGDDYSKGCEFKFMSGKALQFVKSKGFTIVRKVCFNFQNGDGFTFTEFQDHLFGSYRPSEVSVIIDMWRGVGEPQRVLITDKICKEKHPFREQIQPSPRLLQDAQTYKDKFLGPEDYIAVITRFEMTGLSRQYQLRNDTHAEIPICVTRTLSHLNQLRSDTGINNTFLSIDIGKYGSSSFAKKKYYNHLQDMVKFVCDVYKGRMVLSDIEHTLEHVSRTTDSGYIASLQQLVVTRARCILFMGGGSFQRHALHMYQDIHPHIEDQCIHVVQSCTSPYRPII